METSILFLALRGTSNSRLTRPFLLTFWPENAKNAKTTDVRPLKETIPLTKKKAPFLKVGRLLQMQKKTTKEKNSLTGSPAPHKQTRGVTVVINALGVRYLLLDVWLIN